jgi:hypothetical protein
MKNIFDVLKQKEAELQQIQKEVEALRTAARLLNEEGEARPAESPPRPATVSAGPVPAPRPIETAAGFDASPRQFP